MKTGPKKAMFLGAGLGTRMRHLTEDRPKALVEVVGRPLIDYAIERLLSVGIETIVVNVHYMADKLEDYLANRKDAEFIISDERTLLMDTGGAIVKVLPLFGDEPFITHNSDSIWRENQGENAIKNLIETFDPEAMDGLMLLADRKTSIGFDGKGDFFLGADHRISRRAQAAEAPFTWNGVQIIHPRMFEGAPEGPFSTNIVWDRSIAKDKLFGLELKARWMHVGSPDAVADTERYLNEHGYQ